MKKTLLSTAVLAGMIAGTAHAAVNEPTIYGEVHLAGEYITDVSDGIEDESDKNMVSRDTFVGIKGAQGLNNGLDLLYDVQAGFDLDSASSEEDFKLRKASVGLANDVFSVHAGRLANPYADLTKQNDVFKSSLASANSVIPTTKVDHLDSTIAAFATPVKDLKVGASYTYGSDQSDETIGFNESETEFDAYSLTASYDFGMASVYGGYQKLSFDDNGFNVSGDSKSYKLGTVITPMDNLQVNLSGERNKVAGESSTNYLAQTAYGLTSKVDLKAGLGYIGSTDTTESGNFYALGADYKLADNTTVGAAYAHVDTDTSTQLDRYSTVGDSNAGFSVSLNHKF